MKVTIVSPERVLFEGEADGVKVPGEKGRFEILKGHAPIISTLSLPVKWRAAAQSRSPLP